MCANSKARKGIAAFDVCCQHNICICLFTRPVNLAFRLSFKEALFFFKSTYDLRKTLFSGFSL
uniref:hypothetical protein n=1 Tax=Salmonella sp. TaxID=599 RepID=UPI001CD91CD4|nr:hypothetical protein [Salmonella sp.]